MTQSKTEKWTPPMVESIFVFHGGFNYLCRWTSRKFGPAWKCGKCYQGLIDPRLGFKCRVCQAEVVKIVPIEARGEGIRGNE